MCLNKRKSILNRIYLATTGKVDNFRSLFKIGRRHWGKVLGSPSVDMRKLSQIYLKIRIILPFKVLFVNFMPKCLCEIANTN